MYHLEVAEGGGNAFDGLGDVGVAEQVAEPHGGCEVSGQRFGEAHGDGSRPGISSSATVPAMLLRDLERVLEFGLERADDDLVAVQAIGEQDLAALPAHVVEHHPALLAAGAAQASLPADIRVVRPHGVDDAPAAGQLVDNELLLAAEIDGLGDLEALEDDPAEERVEFGHRVSRLRPRDAGGCDSPPPSRSRRGARRRAC